MMEKFTFRRPLTDTRAISLEPENELRIMTDERTDGVVVLLENGLAEIYGVEMTQFREYKFPSNSNIAVFTWQGCTIRITGKPRSVCVVKDTLMIINVILHAFLQERRVDAERRGIIGPITLIVGPADVGKTTLCRILLNYAARMGKRPMYVDLDVGQNSISVAGNVGLLAVDKTTDIVKGYDVKDAKVYHFGHKSPKDNIILYFLLLKHLGNVLKMKLRYDNPNGRSSGVIINTCGWVRGNGYDAIILAAMNFEIDYLMVIGDERLHDKLSRDMPNNIQVHYMPKLGGVVERSSVLRVKAHTAKIMEYFYGLLNPLHSINMHFSEIKIFRVVAQPVPDDFDSTTVALNNIKLKPVDLSLQLVGHVLSLIKFDNDETITDNVALNEVIGFVTVKRVFIATGGICLCSTKPRPLPSNVFLMGDMKFV